MEPVLGKLLQGRKGGAWVGGKTGGGGGGGGLGINSGLVEESFADISSGGKGGKRKKKKNQPIRRRVINIEGEMVNATPRFEPLWTLACKYRGD